MWRSVWLLSEAEGEHEKQEELCPHLKLTPSAARDLNIETKTNSSWDEVNLSHRI